MSEIDVQIMELFCSLTIQQKQEIMNFAEALVESEPEEASSDRE